jgi:hypothetical protein
MNRSMVNLKEKSNGQEESSKEEDRQEEDRQEDEEEVTQQPAEACSSSAPVGGRW